MGGFPGGSAGKESTLNAGDLGLIPELGSSPGEGRGYPLQYSGLENSKNYIVHGIAKSWTRNEQPSLTPLLPGLPWWFSGKELAANAGDTGSVTRLEDLLEKEIGTHSSILAWEIPWTEEHGRLQSMGVTKILDMTEQLNNN